jgi:8-oxo-dGTP pyrophosphatase MutT (NUDIX family)
MKRAAFATFRRMPRPVRLAAIHAATPSYTVGVVMALRDVDDRLLMVKQRHTGGWALPGGLLGRHESAADGIVREVAEEVGLTLDPDRLPIPLASVAPRARRVDVVYSFRAGPDVHPRIGADDVEVTDVGWYPLDDLPDVTLPTLDILRGVRLL